ncbi:hypothetical protein VZT92_002484 [Zoarces viviparus]|uniref:Uncharacterized protein n=1 Tax=Zoarces viviparus TaxID=48416 RepID=A0AAW1G083_ZOAVI
MRCSGAASAQNLSPPNNAPLCDNIMQSNGERLPDTERIMYISNTRKSLRNLSCQCWPGAAVFGSGCGGTIAKDASRA